MDEGAARNGVGATGQVGKRGMLTLRNAVENASVVPVSDEQIVAALRGEGGHGSHLRALFGDVWLQALAEAGRSHGIGMDTILAAYEDARRTAAAANPELDEALAERRRWSAQARTPAGNEARTT